MKHIALLMVVAVAACGPGPGYTIPNNTCPQRYPEICISLPATAPTPALESAPPPAPTKPLTKKQQAELAKQQAEEEAKNAAERERWAKIADDQARHRAAEAANYAADEAECQYELNNSPVAQRGGFINMLVNNTVIFDQCMRAKALRRAAQAGR